MRRTRLPATLLAIAACAALAACGSSSKSSSTSSGSSGSGSSSGSLNQSGGAGALSAEVKSAATGDIPDNQNFLTYKDTAAGYTISYPEGWTQSGSGKDVTFRDKNNIIHVVVASGPRPSLASVSSELAKERAKTATLVAGKPSQVSLKGGQAVKVTYSTESAPNPVTGKRVKLMVDRYVVGGPGGKVATLDLGTPVGVDNVDAYKMIANSFRWR